MLPIAQAQFYDTISAILHASASLRREADLSALSPPFNDLTQFVLEQHARSPDYLGAPLLAATLLFDLGAVPLNGKPFHRLPLPQRSQIVKAWKESNLGFKRDLIRYVESLGSLALYSRIGPAAPRNAAPFPADGVMHQPSPELRTEVAVVGSGPGGAITACLLAEAGRNVLLIEEGDFLSLDSCAPFSKEEMTQKYRHGGQTVAMGANKIAYVEGCCVGGGSEINSGLYHRTPPDILERWRREFEVQGLTSAELLPHFETAEKDVSVSFLPGAAPGASLKLHDGATKLGWKSLEVPRWVSYPEGSQPGGRRQSMTETYIPRFLRAGGRLLPRTRVNRLRQENGGWQVEASRDGNEIRLQAEQLFICGGAVQTPALLRRNGITRNLGNSLHLHPTIKVIARFPEQVNSAAMGVPVHQVKEFSPRLSFGCSVSNPAYLAVGLLDHPGQAVRLSEEWRQLATYYAMITGSGRGTVRTLPGCRHPLVRYRLGQSDRRDLAEGVRKLCEILLASGANRLLPSLLKGPVIQGPDDLSRIPAEIPTGLTSLMTIHLFSSCPMGENQAVCATDSFGRVHGFKNLRVADASLLCTAPGVNPQGTIMALAHRNARQFLETNRH